VYFQDKFFLYIDFLNNVFKTVVCKILFLHSRSSKKIE